jgi:hypothetical protein
MDVTVVYSSPQLGDATAKSYTQVSIANLKERRGRTLPEKGGYVTNRSDAEWKLSRYMAGDDTDNKDAVNIAVSSHGFLKILEWYRVAG